MMTITIRKLRSVFLREEWREEAPSPYDMDEDGYLIPEVEEWCRTTFGRIPTVYFDEFINDYDQLGSNCWLIWFRTEADAIAFKMRWQDYGR